MKRKRVKLEKPEDWRRMLVRRVLAKLDAKELDTTNLRRYIESGNLLMAVYETAAIMNKVPEGYLEEFVSYQQHDAASKPRKPRSLKMLAIQLVDEGEDYTDREYWDRMKPMYITDIRDGRVYYRDENNKPYDHLTSSLNRVLRKIQNS